MPDTGNVAVKEADLLFCSFQGLLSGRTYDQMFTPLERLSLSSEMVKPGPKLEDRGALGRCFARTRK